MFYNKKIGIVDISEGHTDEFGIWQPGETSVTKTIKADVQPITKELASRDFGYDEDVEYRIYCDIEDFETGDIIEYNNKKYKIVKMLVWDTYMDLLVNCYE